MRGHQDQSVQRYCDLTGVDRATPNEVSTPCMDDHQFNASDFEIQGKIKPHDSKIVLKWLYGARVNRMDLYWTVNALARNVTKWTVADDKRLHKLMCYIEHTKDWVLKTHVGDYPEHIRIIEFADASFAGDLTDSKYIRFHPMLDRTTNICTAHMDV